MHSAGINAPTAGNPKGSRSWQLLEILKRNADGLTTDEIFREMFRWYGVTSHTVSTDMAGLRQELDKDPSQGWELPEAEPTAAEDEKHGRRTVYMYRLRRREVVGAGATQKNLF